MPARSAPRCTCRSAARAAPATATARPGRPRSTRSPNGRPSISTTAGGFRRRRSTSIRRKSRSAEREGTRMVIRRAGSASGHEPSTPAVPRGGEGALRHGFASFYGAPIVEDMDDWHADVGFVGVPFDAGTNDRPGARFGPAAVRDASARYHPADEWQGWIDAERGARILQGVSMADVGDVDVRTVDLLENFAIITDAARLVRRNCRIP